MSQPLTLTECQTIVAGMMKSRGWDNRSTVLQTVMMAEEMGEVAKAVRYLELKGPTPENKKELALELADVLNYVCWLATKNDIDLQGAFLEKYQVNEGRTW